MIVLGISEYQHPHLHERGFYTVDGTHRMFTMPYEPIEGGNGSSRVSDSQAEGGARAGMHSTMWQLSWSEPDEAAARALCAPGGNVQLLAEVRRRCAAWPHAFWAWCA